MARIFISYSRADRQFVDQFIPLIRRVYGNDSLWFDDDIHGGVDWWQTILNEIDKCDLFVYLVSSESLESPYCQAELREALRLKKQILPVIVRRLNPVYPGNIEDDLAVVLRRTQYVDMSGGFRDANTIASLYAALTRLLNAIPQQPLNPVTLTPTPQPPVPDKKKPNSNISAAYIGGGFVLVAAIITGIFGLWQGALANSLTPEPLPATTAAVVVADLPSETPEPTDEPTITPTPTGKQTITPTPTMTETPNIIAAAQPAIQQQTVQAMIFATETLIAQVTRSAVLTAQFSAGSTATHILQLSLVAPVTNIPTPFPTSTDTPTATIASQNPMAVVNVTSANLRSGPGTNYTRVGSVFAGTSFPVVARTTNSDWYLVELESGERAWIWAGIIDVIKSSETYIEIVATIPPTFARPPLVSTTSPTVTNIPLNDTMSCSSTPSRSLPGAIAISNGAFLLFATGPGISGSQFDCNDRGCTLPSGTSILLRERHGAYPGNPIFEQCRWWSVSVVGYNIMGVVAEYNEDGSHYFFSQP